MSPEVRQRSVVLYAFAQAIVFTVLFALQILFLTGIAHLLGFFELNWRILYALAIFCPLGFALGFMRGLGTGFAHNPHHQNQHKIIFISGIALAAIVLAALVGSLTLLAGRDIMAVSRDGIIATILGLAFLSFLLGAMAYAQKKEDAKALAKKAT